MVVGRFAPSPSGRMHLGNLFSALLAWLSVRSANGKLILRIEDLDPERCKPEYATQIREDLRWLGLDWDQEEIPQSQRTALYQEIFEQLSAAQLVYPCYCSRASLHAASAPHATDGTFIYAGTCRTLSAKERAVQRKKPAWRLRVPAKEYLFEDGLLGFFSQQLERDCGDFIIRRADGVFAYQLAVVADDAAMGVTQVVRGKDLLDSTPRQLYLYDLLHVHPPEFYHVPLLLAPDGRRLSKREKDLDMAFLREHTQPNQIIGLLAWLAGILNNPIPMTPQDLLPFFSWKRVSKENITLETSVVEAILFCRD